MPTKLQPGDMVPVRQLQPLTGGPPVRLGSNRPRAHVVVVTHAEPCGACSDYLQSFEAAADAFRDEKGDVLALVTSAWRDDAASLPVAAAVADPVILDALAPSRTPVVAVIDRFGQLFTRVDAGDEHSFPPHDKLLFTLLDIGIRCPECGVPDVPSPGSLPEEGTRSGGMLLGQ